MATTDTTLDDKAGQPLSVQTASAMVKQHTLTEQIEYDRYKAGKTARTRSRSALAGLVISRAISGGTVGRVAPGTDTLGP